MRRLALVVGLCASPLAADSLDVALQRGGLTRADLGLVPPADVRGVPRAEGSQRMAHVEALLEQPLRLPLFADAYREAAARFGADAARLFGALAIQPRLAGVGTSFANLSEADDLALALDELRRPLAPVRVAPGVFGGGTARYPGRASAASSADAARLPEPLRRPLARLLFALCDADGWVRLAWRRVPTSSAASAPRQARLLPDISSGALFLPDVEDAAREIDGASLAYASLKAVAAVERAAAELATVAVDARWQVDTPRGRVVLAGRANDQHRLEAGQRGLLALVDLGGDDEYAGSFAAGIWPQQPVSLVLDLSGNDRYVAEAEAQGSGLGGVGVLLDVAGDDHYQAGERAQGFGQLGSGILIDGAGRDEYALGSAGQGAAVFGAGLLLDRAGDDRYALLGDGQGVGGPGGCGTLVDLAGDDRYEAAVDPARTGRADPRADSQASISNAQGVGIGRRGDGSDGRAWAGGIGALVDLAGRDQYLCGTWCAGAGYWYGTGLLVDAGGTDTYEASWYAQGSAAHHGLGALVDLSGDDHYRLVGSGGAGLGFGWDFALGFLLDLQGDDSYHARVLALGAAAQRSQAFFVDAAGDDRYAAEAQALGHVDRDERYDTRDGLAPAWFETAQAGIFLDLDGDDAYPAWRGSQGSGWGEAGQRRSLGAGVDESAAALPEELRSLADRR